MAKVLRIDDWRSNGTGALLASSAYKQITAARFSVTSMLSPPWLASGQTGYFLRCTLQSGDSTANPGPGTYFVLPNIYQAMVHGFWFRPSTLPVSSGVAFWRANDGQNLSQTYGQDHWYLDLHTDGNIYAQNSSNTAFGNTTSALVAGTWYFLDIFGNIGDAGGGTGKLGAVSVKLYNADGTLKDSIVNTSCDTRTSTGGGQTSSYSQSSFTFDGEFNNNAVLDFGPSYWLDPQGGGSGTMLGPQYFSIFPWLSNFSTQFTPSSGANYTIANQIPPGPATLTDSTHGHRDEYNPTNLTGSATSIVAALIGVAQKSAVGSRLIATLFDNGTSIERTMRSLQVGSLVEFNHIYNQDPSGANWLLAALNGIRGGIEVGW